MMGDAGGSVGGVSGVFSVGVDVSVLWKCKKVETFNLYIKKT